MLVNGVTLTPNKALTDTAVLTYSPEGIATEVRRRPSWARGSPLAIALALPKLMTTRFAI